MPRDPSRHREKWISERGAEGNACATSLFGEEAVLVADVGNAHDQDLHPALRAVHDSGRDMHQGAFLDGLLHAVEDDHSSALDHVVKLGGALMVVLASAVD